MQGQLPHSRLSTTEIYTHLLEDVQREAVDRMDAIITDLAHACERTRASS